jgi:hypothetical protein
LQPEPQLDRLAVDHILQADLQPDLYVRKIEKNLLLPSHSALESMYFF